MEPNNTSPVREQRNAFRDFMRSHTARFIIVGFISLILMIPLSQVGLLIGERQMRQDDVTDELEKEWGGAVTYFGLVIKVPVTETRRYEVKDNAKSPPRMETEVIQHTAYIYPESSSDVIQSEVTEKYRGIFSTPIFTATIAGKARFNLSELVKANAGREINWSKARIGFITNREARFREISGISVNGKLLPVASQDIIESGDDMMLNSTDPFHLDPTKTSIIDVSLNTTLNGSQAIRYEPLATKSTMSMQSNWKDPAFAGTSLPTSNITENGFQSTWKNMVIGTGSRLHLDAVPHYTTKFSDVRFIKLVDHYQLNERTVKYGLLVLVLTFAVFFLIQIVGKVAIHPLHYFMIGLALLLFYSLLLSFSEQIGFIPAYLIASITIVVLIVWYARSVLKSMKFAVMSGLSLGLLYAFLLVIVNLEVYALIVGSIGLLFVLAAIMSVTRKINFETT
jgi:inner membrane protein